MAWHSKRKYTVKEIWQQHINCPIAALLLDTIQQIVNHCMKEGNTINARSNSHNVSNLMINIDELNRSMMGVRARASKT